MSHSVTLEDILSLQTDAIAVSVEIALDVSETPVCRRVARFGGETLDESIRALRFLPVGSAAEIAGHALPFAHFFAVAAPTWLTGKANEFLALRRSYQSLFETALAAGCRSIALPFLSACCYRFPKDEAIKIAFSEADRTARYALSRIPYRKPEIVSYVGWYRDHALFALDNGLYARVDLRPENIDVTIIPYFEACFRAGNNPKQPPLSEEEIARLRRIYEENDW